MSTIIILRYDPKNIYEMVGKYIVESAVWVRATFQLQYLRRGSHGPSGAANCFETLRFVGLVKKKAELSQYDCDIE